MRLIDLIRLQAERLQEATALLEKLQPDIPEGTPEAEQYAQNLADGRASLAARKQFIAQLEGAQTALNNYTTHQSNATLESLVRSYKTLFVSQENPIARQYLAPQSDPTPRLGCGSCRRKLVAKLRQALEKQYSDDLFG
ncbi:MAG: hypothetical protein ACOCZ8_02570 [Bacteroidota bacterium]